VANHNIAFGWAIVSTVNGVDYVDLQGDHIPEDVLLESMVKFADVRVGKTMHFGPVTGKVLFMFPMLDDIANALGIYSTKTGMIIGMQVGEDVIKKIEDGTFKGFSMGGWFSE
jgi:hypothetical protein